MSLLQDAFSGLGGKVLKFFNQRSPDNAPSMNKRIKLSKPEAYNFRWITSDGLIQLSKEYARFKMKLEMVSHAVEGAPTPQKIDDLLSPMASALLDRKDSKTISGPGPTYTFSSLFVEHCKQSLAGLDRFYDAMRIIKLRDKNQFVPDSLNLNLSTEELDSISRIKEFMAAPPLPKVCEDILEASNLSMMDVPVDFMDRIVLDLSATLENYTPPSYVNSGEYREAVLASCPRPHRADTMEDASLPGSFPETADTTQSSMQRRSNKQGKRRAPIHGSLYMDILHKSIARMGLHDDATDPRRLDNARRPQDSKPRVQPYKDDFSDTLHKASMQQMLKSKRRSMLKATPMRPKASRRFHVPTLSEAAASQKSETPGRHRYDAPRLESFTFTSPLPQSRRSKSINGIPYAPLISSKDATIKDTTHRSRYTSTHQKKPTAKGDVGKFNDSEPSQEAERAKGSSPPIWERRKQLIKHEAKERVLDANELQLYKRVLKHSLKLPLRPLGIETSRLIDKLLATPSDRPLRISDDATAGIKLRKEQEALKAAEEARNEAEAARRAAARKAKRDLDARLALSGGLRVPKERLVGPVTTAWTRRAQETLEADDDLMLATTKEGTELRRHDFAKVVPPTEWLNDEIVNGALNWLDHAINSAAGIKDVKKQTRKCLSMSSFFLKRLQDQVTGTQRTLRRFGVHKDNIMDIETILVPICERSHWTLLVIRPKKKTVAHMDSLNPRGRNEYTKLGLAWMKDVLQEKFKDDDWKVVRHESPPQTNGHDCGVHTITNGICIALGLSPIDSYASEDMPLQRIRIASTLLNGGFKGDFDLCLY